MNASIINFFVDSNLFLQCRPLEQLDWTSWKDFEEVRLIVSRPVLREIDYRKNKGSDRVGKRARAASAMFRKMLPEGHKIIRSSEPGVILSVKPQYTYCEDSEGHFNYQERDDQLVATISAFARNHPDCEVRLLTHDTTPLYTAHSLNLKADQIPDEWLLPPENTAVEKQVANLKNENARLRKAEPFITLRWLARSQSESKKYGASFTWFEPLTDEQVDELMRRLKDRFPLETDFGSPDVAEQAVRNTQLKTFLGNTRVFSPASDQEIAKYRDEAYPRWVEECEDVLRDYHLKLQREFPALVFSFLVKNTGTRPAVDALITIEAQGDFLIQPPPYRVDDGEQSDEEDIQEKEQTDNLNSPPVAPRGKWRWTGGRRLADQLRATESSGQALLHLPDLSDQANRNLDFLLRDPSLAEIPERDSNAFYYKPCRPAEPSLSFSLECDQWRHEGGELAIGGKIIVPSGQSVVKGALSCRIQAANLSRSACESIPVEIEITHRSAFDKARVMLESFLTRPEIRSDETARYR